MSDKSDAPDALDLALPFYATGRAASDDKAAVEAALRDRDGDIAARLERVCEEMHETRQVNEALGMPSARVAERLFSRIDRTVPVPPRERGGTTPIAAKIAGWIAGASPRLIGWSAAAVIIIETGLVGGLWVSRPSSTFKTASAPSETGSGSFALVGFVPNTPIAQIGALLQQHGVTIIDGPKPGGFYRLRLAQTKLTPSALAEALTALRSETSIVRFVAPEP